MDDWEAVTFSDLCAEISDVFMGETGDLIRAHADLIRAIRQVEALHFERGRNILGRPVCNECSPLQPMPCPTLRALHGAA